MGDRKPQNAQQTTPIFIALQQQPVVKGGTIHHWWFGYAHFAADPADHPMVGKLGPNALDLSLDEFRALLSGRRGAIKSFLLDQGRIAGIGNFYVQTPLGGPRSTRCGRSRV